MFILFSLFLVRWDKHDLEVVYREKNIYYFENMEKICVWKKLTFSSIAWNHRLNFMSCRDAFYGLTGIDSWYHVQGGIVAIPFMNLLSQGFNPWFRLSSLQHFFSEAKKRFIMEWHFNFYGVVSNKVSNKLMASISLSNNCKHLYLQCPLIGIWIVW